jgi:hypothetical protein
MTSNDNQQYVTFEVYNSGITELKQYINSQNESIHSELKELKSEILAVRDIALVNSAKIDAYRDFSGIWFTVIAIVATLIGIMTTFAPMFREMYRDAKKDKDRESLRNIIREEVDIAVNRALNVK